MYTILDVVVVVASIFVINFVKRAMQGNPRPVFNVYQRPNGFYWFKVVFMYIILSIKQVGIMNDNADSVEYEEYRKLERPQQLSYHEHAVDAVYFNAANGNGDHFVVGTARRKNKLMDGFVYLKLNIPGIGLLESPKLPDTALYQDNETEEFAANGIKITPVEPMKKWKITYDGKMKKFNNEKEIFDVKIDVTWTSFLPYFNFDKHMDPLAMAKSLAKEQWSRTYFNTLKDIHQTHYEQHGDLTGTVAINEETHKLHMAAMRDHSFGVKREWKIFHRYGLHFLSTKNGDRITVGMVCIPVSFSCLTIGYVYSAEDKQIYPVQECDLELYQHGENGEPPVDYSFVFTAGGKQYHMQVNVIDSPAFYISKDWDCKVIERLCKFTVNGIDGWGAAEWVYRNPKGKRIQTM